MLYNCIIEHIISNQEPNLYTYLCVLKKIWTQENEPAFDEIRPPSNETIQLKFHEDVVARKKRATTELWSKENHHQIHGSKRQKAIRRSTNSKPFSLKNLR